MKFSRRIVTLLLGLALSVLQLSNALASVIYDNGSPTTVDGYTISGAIGGPGTTTTDDFILPSAASIGGVGFYFQNYDGITGWDGNIDYAFRADSSGNPGAILASGSGQNVASSLSAYPWCCTGGNAWLITFDLQSPFAASGSTTYWLELGGAGGPTPWWVTTGSGNAKYLNGNTVAITFSNGVSFYLTDSTQIPEPSMLALLGLGLAGLAATRRRKQ